MCQGAALLVGIGRTVYAAGRDVVARHGFTLPDAGAGIEHVEIAGAEDPFERWSDRHRRC